MITLTSFGAIPNDRTQQARAINAAAWLDAMNAMRREGIEAAATLVIEGGDFYFPGPVYMTRHCIVAGEGGSANSVSRLLFPHNGAGIIVDSGTSPDDPRSNASWGKIQNLDIVNEGPSSVVQRRVNWRYTPGDIVISPGNNDLMFKCTVGGTTSESLSRFDSATDGSTIEEANRTTWVTIPRADLPMKLWQPGTDYEIGDIVVSNGFDLAGQHYGDSRFVYICKAAGQSGKCDPFGSQIIDTEIQEIDCLDDYHPDDDTQQRPIWRVRTWSAILMLSSIHVDNVSTSRWPNAAIHVHSPTFDERDGRRFNANNFIVTNLKSQNDGMGIYVFGSDANVGFIGYCQVLGPGAYTPGNGGHGFWDHSLSSCLWINNYAEDGTGAGWISETVGKVTWVNNTSEMPIHNVVRQGSVTSLGNSPWHPTMVQSLTHFDFTDGRRIGTTDSSSRVTVSTQRGSQGFVDTFSTTDDQNAFIGRTYNLNLSNFLRGWYTDFFFGQNNAYISGISGLMAEEGPGHQWIPAGTFVGQPSAKRYFGYDPEMWTSNRLREGKRNFGDVFIIKPYAVAGEWMGIVVTSPGTKGFSWKPDYQYFEKRMGVWNLPADIVEPGDGFAYACTRSGKSGGVERPPLFTAHTTLGVNAPLWNANTRYWPAREKTNIINPASKVRPTRANGHWYQMKSYPEWTPNTPVLPDQITTPDSNGNLFFAYVQTWIRDASILLGRFMQPTIPNGKVYKVKRVTGNLSSIGKTASAEPEWFRLSNPNDELPDGTVVWQLDTLKTGSTEPGWDTRPNGSTYDNNIEWRFFVPMTGSTEPDWNIAPNSETVDAPGAKVTPEGGVEAGFGVVWIESGPDLEESKVPDNECEWTRIDRVPVTANVFPVGDASTPVFPVGDASTPVFPVGDASAPVFPAGEVNTPRPVETMKLSLNRRSLTNVDDAGGRWQYEGGEAAREGELIANYASTKRIVIQGTEPQNTAILTLTLFFVKSTSQAVENITLQGSHDFSSGDEIGSVSAASNAFSSYIGKQFKRSGTTLVIG